MAREQSGQSSSASPSLIVGVSVRAGSQCEQSGREPEQDRRVKQGPERMDTCNRDTLSSSRNPNIPQHIDQGPQ